jgi:hypothetical protein
VIPGGAGFEDHLTLPKALPLSGGIRPASGTIFMSFDVDSANQVNTTIQLVISTPRGVRCCNLGQPEHFTVLPDGTVEGAKVLWLDDCKHLPPNFGDMTPEEYERWRGTIWYTYWGLIPGKDYDPENPPILPDTLADIPADWSEATVAPPAAVMVPDTGELVLVAGPDTDLQAVVTVPDSFEVATVDNGATVTAVDAGATLVAVTTGETGQTAVTQGTRITEGTGVSDAGQVGADG